MGNFSHLPTDILLDIITRLPTESILDCRSVCRPWRNLILHHPSFYQMYLSNLNHSTEESGKLTFLVRAENQQLHCFVYDEKHDETPVDCIRRINCTPPFKYYKLLGSFNGLVCLYDWVDSAYCICNPMTREYVVLPKCDRHSGGQYCPSGFGYLSVTNEYKVVELYQLRTDPDGLCVAVYTLGDGNGWRSVGRFGNRFGNGYGGLGVFVNGSLHWRDERGGDILAFDLTREKFGEHLSPPLRSRFYTLGELGGVLYCSIRDYGQNYEYYDIWLPKKKNDIYDMNEQVEHKPLGWSKEFRLSGREPLAISKSGGVLCFDHLSLGIYDPTATTLKELVGFSAFSQIIPHRNTLISMKELGEEDVRIMESAGIKETETRDLLTKQVAR